MDTLIRYENVNFTYPGQETPVLSDFSLTIAAGSFVALLGHNGSGKSTLAKHTNAILLPTSGRVFVSNLDTADEQNQLQIRQTVSMVFQNPDNQIVATVVEEDVAFGLENIGVPSAEIRARVDQALRDVGMYEFREHAPHRLSGGQKQRVAIAGAIAMRPKCIVFDEPTAMLDPVGRREVLTTIQKLRDTYGITIILVTHHMNEAALADRLVVMNKGALYMDGTPAEIFAQVDNLRAVGLAPPQTVALLHALQQNGWSVPLDALSVEACAATIQAVAPATISYAEPLTPVVAFPKSATPKLELRGITHIYGESTPFERHALQNVNFSLEKGEFRGIIGHTGSGKSTLIQHLNALLKPNAGQVLLDGADIWANGYNLRAVRFKVGLVFQYPEYQLFEETVAADIAFGPKNMGLTGASLDERVNEAMQFVGLNETLRDKSPFELSGGQKRRVAIAGVIAMRPEVLILDEPTAGLDPHGRDEILEHIKAYHRTQNSSVVLVTHSMDELAQTVDSVTVMADAKTLLEGHPRTVFAQAPLLEAHGLSVPGVTAVFNRLNALGLSVPSVLTLSEGVAALGRLGGASC